jgi:hypothetical protein
MPNQNSTGGYCKHGWRNCGFCKLESKINHTLGSRVRMYNNYHVIKHERQRAWNRRVKK